jgi:hypothetical protein
MDVEEMARVSKLRASPPLYVEALQEKKTGSEIKKRVASARKGLPWQKLASDYVVFHTTPQIHAVYSATWGTLSLLITGLTFYRFRRPPRLRPPAPRRAVR